MTSQLLVAELANLIQDSKRKNSELRSAAEKSLQDLKSLPNTSEAQLTADLSRRPHFISPFLIACNTHNAKFTSTGVSCLQRLCVSRTLPRERIEEVLEALKESVTSNHETQLKILQTLPPLLQNYAIETRGRSLFTVLHICSNLQSVKNFAVSNTAAATLQQLVTAVLERVSSEDARALEIPTIKTIKCDDKSIAVRPAAHDAYRILNDLIILVVGEKSTFVRFSPIAQTATLELIETILFNHNAVVSAHQELIHLLRTILVPLIIRSLSDSLSFPVTVRIFRILNLIFRNHLNTLPSECEIMLGLLNHMLDPESSQIWKRALCLEIFRGLYADWRLLFAIYSHFDAVEGKKCIFGDNLASFVRFAHEKPALIGLGQHSTNPTSLEDGRNIMSEQTVTEAGVLVGIIGGSGENSNALPPGISTQWSSVKTSCLDCLDKTEAPTLPDTYIYSLILICITNVSESLARFVLPLTVHPESKNRRKNKTENSSEQDAETTSQAPSNHQLSRTQSFRKKTIPVDPLELTYHPVYPHVETSSALVSECWPAVLATCSTFLNAALDADFYRALVRAVQKFTQVAGLLRKATPRDAFLTALGKAAIPSNLMMTGAASPRIVTGERVMKGLLSVDNLVSQLSVDKSRRASHEVIPATLSPRNLLCLRALLNLAIALGPTLHTAWSIVFETLQTADLVMAMAVPNATLTGRGEIESSMDEIENETSAVQAATRRLFESTVDYPNDCFLEMLQSLCSLLHPSPASDGSQRTPATSSRQPVLHQRRISSISGTPLSTETNSRDAAFALNKIGELASLNESRLAQFDAAESGWDVFITEIVRYTADNRRAASTRLLAADVLAQSIRELAELSMTEDHHEHIQARILDAIRKQISALHNKSNSGTDAASDTSKRIHQVALDALKSVIEHCGESLVAGWGAVLDSLMGVFITTAKPMIDHQEGTIISNAKVQQSGHYVEVVSRLLARSAFATVNLICSDFLSALPEVTLSILLTLLKKFCCQQEDLNMSLTAITYFWNVSDYLRSRGNMTASSELLNGIQQEGDFRHAIISYAQQGSPPALWLQVLLSLMAITTDERAQVRNSAIQTVQRIFENYADQLSSDIWIFCLRTILFGAVEANLEAQRDIRATPRALDNLKEWDETTKTILHTISVLMVLYLEKIDASQLNDAWSILLNHLQKYFMLGSHALNESIFKTISGVLSQLETSQRLDQSSLENTSLVWKHYFSTGITQNSGQSGSQDAYVACTEAFKAIYSLAGTSLDADLPSMLLNLETCIVNSDLDSYSSDLDHMTPLQKSTLECISIVELSNSERLLLSAISLLSRFILLPYNAPKRNHDKGGPTFVALSKSSMTLLQHINKEHAKQDGIFANGTFSLSLESLAKPVQEKYRWQREGKSPTLWQKATTTAISILKVTLQRMILNENKEGWNHIVNIAHYMMRAQPTSSQTPITTIRQDETFDIEAFNQLRELVTVALGSPSLPDTLRRTYTRNLFTTSLIHSPLPGELPDITASPLEDLYKIRLGQTAELEVTSRTRMSYVCLTELFNLVTVQDSSPERIKLAQAAAPYLILRAALPLKTYIADHPLRGRMPVSESERQEIVFVLTALHKLQIESQAIPDAPSVRSKHRKHLHRLYPLLVKASRAARYDGEIFEKLAGLINLVGGEFGLDDG